VLLEGLRSRRARTGAPSRDLPERFGNWNTIYKNFDRWSKAGVWARVLEQVQAMAHQGGDVDWIASIDSTIVRVHQHGANPAQRHRGPADHAIGRSRGGLTTKTHLVADGKGRALAFVLTGGQVADTTMLPDTRRAVERLSLLSDAAAAIAITLLALDLPVDAAPPCRRSGRQSGTAGAIT
jgi:transposase